MEKYSIGCWEIDRYEVHLYVNGNDLGGNNYFGCEEDAVVFAQKYVKEHPGWTARVFKLERACFETF